MTIFCHNTVIYNGIVTWQLTNKTDWRIDCSIFSQLKIKQLLSTVKCRLNWLTFENSLIFRVSMWILAHYPQNNCIWSRMYYHKSLYQHVQEDKELLSVTNPATILNTWCTTEHVMVCGGCWISYLTILNFAVFFFFDVQLWSL